MNASSKKLTLAALSLLQRGLNFVVTPKAPPVEDAVVATEEACRHLGEDKAASLCSEVDKTVTRAKQWSIPVDEAIRIIQGRLQKGYLSFRQM